ncbi:MAG TPA: hypothetical protein VKD72_09000 [Gemmataceae bacterium]|nr:hypothetical protein [Gemmataceae bacterium]
MSTTTTTSPAVGRGLLWLGLGCAFLGLGVYVLLLRAGRFDTPWYAPALATLGTGLVLMALWRRRSVWRILALVLVSLLAGGEWWFLEQSRLPAYSGPLADGTRFPEFRAARADDGKPFRRADLEGKQDTALVFFRGRW